MAGHARLGARRTPTVDRDVGQTAQLAREVLNVGASAPINLGWIFTSQERDLVRARHHRVGKSK
jgi:hypothetical protein